MTPPDKRQSTLPARRRDLYYDQARMQTLAMMLCSRLDEVFDALGVGLHRTSKMFYGPCPVHGGDNPNGFNLYHGGDVPGKWVCRTRHCEETFKRTIIGFVRAMLSKNKHDWTSPKDKRAGGTSRTVSFEEAVDWCCQFLGQKLEDLKVDYSDLEKRQFSTQVSLLTRAQTSPVYTLTRADIRGRLKIPSTYFTGRGWSAEVLNRYDVGLCDDPSKQMFERVVVPVYDDDYRFCVGVTARSIHQKCGQCGTYHRPGNACPFDKQNHPKWRNSKELPRESRLYNYWFAKKHIQRDAVAVLVEGPGDLWRLVEAGIDHGVAMFGNTLSDQQQVILEMSGAMSLIVLTNMDEAGRFGANKIRQELSRSYRIYTPDLPKNDLGDMRPAEVAALVTPILDKAIRQ